MDNVTQDGLDKNPQRIPDWSTRSLSALGLALPCTPHQVTEAYNAELARLHDAYLTALGQVSPSPMEPRAPLAGRSTQRRPLPPYAQKRARVPRTSTAVLAMEEATRRAGIPVGSGRVAPSGRTL